MRSRVRAIGQRFHPAHVRSFLASKSSHSDSKICTYTHTHIYVRIYIYTVYTFYNIHMYTYI